MTQLVTTAFAIWPATAVRGSIAEIVDAGMDDAKALRIWLDSCKRFKSAHTARSYEKEALRFRMWVEWATENEGPRALASVRAEVIDHYLDFLADPQPFPPRLLQRYRKTKQPFKGPLKASSVRQAIVILGGMYEQFREMEDTGGSPYVKFNPFALVRGAITAAARQSVDEPVSMSVSRVLPASLWTIVEAYLDAAVTEHPDDLVAHRNRWVLKLLYHSWIRRQEAASIKMGSFQQIKGNWRLLLIGKGGKGQDIVATIKLMDALRDYRVFRQLPPYPTPGERRPAIDALRGDANVHVTAQTIYRIVKSLLEAVAVTVERHDPESAALLRCAAPHWMRHSGITHAADGGVDVKNTSQQARHADIRTTMRNYYHPDDQVARDQLDNIGKPKLR